MYVIADSHRAVGIPDYFHARSDYTVFTDNHISGDFRAGENNGGSGDRRELAVVLIEVLHTVTFLTLTFANVFHRCA